MHRRTLALISASALLFVAACSVEPTNRDGSTPNPGGPASEPDPAPIVSVVGGEASDAEADSSTDSPSPDESSSADAAASPSASSDADSPSVEVAAGELLELSVDGGEFASVTLTDVDHAGVVDTGSFDADAAADPSDSASADSSDDPTDSQALAGGSLTDSHSHDPSGSASADDAEPADDPSSAEPSADAADETASADADEPAEPQGTEWTSLYELAGGATYAWEAVTVSPDGAEHTSTGTVTTPEYDTEPMRAWTVIGDGQTVGVGAPIAIGFNGPVSEEARAAVEHRLTVTTTDADGDPIDVEGSWAWLYDNGNLSRVHFRPKEFWPAHTKVSVDLALEGISYGPRLQGKEDLTIDFEVGRDQRVEASATTHRMVVTRDGEEIWDFPASLGSPRSPSHNGTHVVMSTHRHYTMTSERWNYETPTEYAVRIHNNGEFIHAAPWSVGSQGRANVSHGCVNLSMADAAAYFDSALYGDPVEITGSSVDLSTADSDISDWVYTWDEWQELSALRD